MNCWRLSVDNSELKSLGGPSHMGTHTNYEIYQTSTLKFGEKSPSASFRGTEKNHFEIHQSTLFFLTRPALRKTSSPKSKLLECCYSLIDLGQGKYPRIASLDILSYLSRMKKKKRNTCEIYSPVLGSLNTET